MDYDAIRGGLQQAVPFNSHVGLEIAEVGHGRGVVRLPDHKELRNHVGTQHAGALFAAGEAASGAAFVGAFGDRLGDIEPVAAAAHITYRRRARGEITATARMSDCDDLVDRLEDEGEVRFSVDVELSDADGEVVAEMTVDWNVRTSTE